MTLSPGTRLGPYEIVAPIGAGGMGEVYRAKDPRLGRDVAVKVLPPSFSADADRLRRFGEEARAAGVLNHPNITAVYDLGSVDDSPYIVTELLEGETLRSTLAGGKLGPRRALDYARQIASGLAAAHDKGIIHRDLKPENLFVTREGRVKILDFGLAKLTHAGEGIDAVTSLPTAAGTEPGVVLGTLAYMSPEQVRGHPADARSDIFSFGAILYEMLSGERAFQRGSAADTISSILKEDPPDLSATNQSVSPALERVVRHCLEKSPEARFRSAHDLAFDLETLSGLSGQSAVSTALPASSARRPAAAVAMGALGLALAAALLVLFVGRNRSDGSPARPLRLTVLAPPGVQLLTQSVPSLPALSPDGRYVGFNALDRGGGTRLWVRDLDDSEARPLAGTEGALSPPFWFPENDAVGFVFRAAGLEFRKASISGGSPQTIWRFPEGYTGAAAFLPGGAMLVGGMQGVRRVPASGGEPELLTEVDTRRGETGHFHPFLLPDGKRFLFLARASKSGEGSVGIGSLEKEPAKRLLSADSQAIFASGHLLFMRRGTLFAQRFDPEKLALSGEPATVAEHVGHSSTFRRGSFSVSQTGILAYAEEAVLPTTEAGWYGRDGKRLGSIPAPPNAQSPELSPDGRLVLFERRDPQTTERDLWLVDLSRGTSSRMTFDAEADDSDPVWSPDGGRVIFASGRGARPGLYEMRLDNPGSEKLLAEHDGRVYPNSWSADGRYLLTATLGDLLLWPLGGTPKPAAFAGSPFVENAAQFSSDGRWVAYMSDESGRSEIFVRAFGQEGGKWQVSTEGGFRPRWRPDGKELYYISPDKKLMAVDVASGPSFAASSPRTLFQTQIAGPLDWGVRFNYAIEPPDGRRLLIVTGVESAERSWFHVIINWTAGLPKP